MTFEIEELEKRKITVYLSEENKAIKRRNPHSGTH